MKNQRAFTSVEMIVVLGLVAVIYLVIAPTFQPSRQAIAEQQFWHELRQDWRAAQVTAQVRHQSTTVQHYLSTRQIVFNSDGHRTILNIPPTIEVEPFE